MSVVRLTSYETVRGVQLSDSEKDELLAGGRIECSPSRGAPGHYDLRADAMVGLVRYGGRQFEIRPRFSTENMLYMLMYGLERARLREEQVQFREHESFVHALAAVYARTLRSALRRGLTQGYVHKREQLRVVRGRIDWQEFARKSFGRAPPVPVIYDDFTEDTPLNQILKAALVELLATLPSEPTRLRRELQELERVFRLVSKLRGWGELPNVTLNRLNGHFGAPLGLARVVLKRRGIRGRVGHVGGVGLLFDVNKVFEDFVVRGLRRRLGLDSWTFPQNAARRGFCLDVEGRIGLEPDLSWWSDAVCFFVGDVKYKRTSYATVPNADVYQMLAYLEATGLKEGLLVYAEGAEPGVFMLPNGRRLQMGVFDLRGGPVQLDAELERLAQVVLGLREQSVRTGRSEGDAHQRRAS